MDWSITSRGLRRATSPWFTTLSFVISVLWMIDFNGWFAFYIFILYHISFSIYSAAACPRIYDSQSLLSPINLSTFLNLYIAFFCQEYKSR